MCYTWFLSIQMLSFFLLGQIPLPALPCPFFLLSFVPSLSPSLLPALCPSGVNKSLFFFWELGLGGSWTNTFPMRRVWVGESQEKIFPLTTLARLLYLGLNLALKNKAQSSLGEQLKAKNWSWPPLPTTPYWRELKAHAKEFPSLFQPIPVSQPQ